MYSQNDEEKYILEALDGTVGRFLDIGAHDGRTLSNTMALAERGWEGVCVEPSPNVFPALLKTHEKRPGIKCVNAPIIPGNEARVMPFYDSRGDLVSTTVQDHVVRWESGSEVRFREFLVMGMPLRALLATVGMDFQFLNLDVESANLELFLDLPEQLMRNLKCICVEHDTFYTKITGYAASFGFSLVAQNGENLIFSK